MKQHAQDSNRIREREKGLALVILKGAADESSRCVGLRIIEIWRLSHDIHKDVMQCHFEK